MSTPGRPNVIVLMTDEHRLGSTVDRQFLNRTDPQSLANLTINVAW